MVITLKEDEMLDCSSVCTDGKSEQVPSDLWGVTKKMNIDILRSFLMVTLISELFLFSLASSAQVDGEDGKK